MIGKLKGIIDTLDSGHLILDVGGVGYVVFASGRTLSRIGRTGEAAELLIETHVREDAITLYGFYDAAEQAWFKLLNSVQGVGAKVALAILSACPPENLALTIAAQDTAAIRQADGVGPKLATRIVTELKDKAGKIELGGTFLIQNQSGKKGASGVAGEPLQNPVNSHINNDAISALINLGYSRSDAYSAVMNASAKANDNDRDNLQTILRMALKELSA